MMLALISLASILYVWKKDSADGRFIIWNSTINLIKDSPILGHGIGGFQSKYMTYQADFLKNTSNENYKDIADNILVPFNEYLNLYVDYGIISLCILLFCFYYFYKIVKTNSNTIIYEEIIIAIFICCLFSYPLSFPITWVMLSYAIAHIYKRTNFISNISKKIFLSVIIPIGILFIVKVCSEYRWRKLFIESLNSKSRNLISKYDNLYLTMYRNPFFTYNFGGILNHAGEYEKSIIILNQSMKMINDYETQILIADSYYATQNYYLAEKSYLLASEMCPNRFIPLYYLVKIYDITNQKEKANKLANIILHKSVKIKSNTISKIKLEMTERINNTRLENNE